MNTLSQPIKTTAKILLIIAAIFSALSNIHNSLTLYILGTGIGASSGATATFSVASFILGTAIETVILFFVFSIATVIGLVLFTVVSNVRSKNSSDEPSTPSSVEQNNAILKFLLLGLLADFILSFIVSIMNSAALYAILSAVSDKHGLILVDAVLSGFLSFCFFVPTLGLIGFIASIIIAIIAISIFGGGSKSSPKR